MHICKTYYNTRKHGRPGTESVTFYTIHIINYTRNYSKQHLMMWNFIWIFLNYLLIQCSCTTVVSWNFKDSFKFTQTDCDLTYYQNIHSQILIAVPFTKYPMAHNHKRKLPLPEYFYLSHQLCLCQHLLNTERFIFKFPHGVGWQFIAYIKMPPITYRYVGLS